MAASQNTQYFQLPIYGVQDPVSFIPSWNDGMQKIDMALHDNQVAGNGNAREIETIHDMVETNSQDIETVQQELENLQTSGPLSFVGQSFTWTMSAGWSRAGLSFLTRRIGNVMFITEFESVANPSELISTTVGSNTAIQVCTIDGNPFNRTSTGMVSSIRNCRSIKNTDNVIGSGQVIYDYVNNQTNLWVTSSIENLQNATFLFTGFIYCQTT